MTANYTEVFALETLEKIQQLTEEDSYDLGCILEFIDENSEDDFIAYYEEYVSTGEDLGYDVVDAFVTHHGSMSYVENVKDAYQGSYNDEETFAEEYYENAYGVNLPCGLVIDWEATWNQNLKYDFDFVNGFVFSSTF
jgi:antirestriction protein